MSRSRDRALRVIAIALMLGGVAMTFADVSGGSRPP
jgi:hypothetical protein